MIYVYKKNNPGVKTLYLFNFDRCYGNKLADKIGLR